MPAANLDTIMKPSYSNALASTLTYVWVPDTVETDLALERIYQHCIEMGADALVDFLISETIDHYPKMNPAAEIEGKRITGLAIRRDD